MNNSLNNDIDSADLLNNNNDDNYKPMDIDQPDIKDTLFPCTKCDKQFENDPSLQQHMQNYHQSTHSCPNCREIFENRRALAYHKRTSHAKDIESELEQTKSTPAVDRHEKIDTTENTCTGKYCGRKFALKSHLSRHLSSCGKNIHPCSECNKAFGSIDKLFSHKKIHNKQTSYSCGNCKTVFESKKALKNHTQVKKCGEFRLDCEICGESFNSKSLDMHKIKHRNDGSNACLKCGDRFEDEALLVSHIKQAHPDHFTCSICDDIFFSKRKLQYHTSFRHSQNKIFCDQCGKEFSDLKILKDHCAAYHSSSFDCSKCSQSFSSHDLLKAHRILEHRWKGNVLCDLCPNVSTSKGNLFRSTESFEEKFELQFLPSRSSGGG